MHVDIGSRVDGFVEHVAVFGEIEVFDTRGLSTDMLNIEIREADLMGCLSGDSISYCDSLSCLCALECFGLGRYGDPISADEHLIGLNNIHVNTEASGEIVSFSSNSSSAYRVQGPKCILGCTPARTFLREVYCRGFFACW